MSKRVRITQTDCTKLARTIASKVMIEYRYEDYVFRWVSNQKVLARLEEHPLGVGGFLDVDYLKVEGLTSEEMEAEIRKAFLPPPSPIRRECLFPTFSSAAAALDNLRPDQPAV